MIIPFEILLLIWLVLCPDHGKNYDREHLYGHSTTIYYVSRNGSDLNSGAQPDQAFATIQHAVDKMQQGDVCRVMAGTYREYIRINGKRNISILVNDDDKVTVTGLDLVKGWESNASGICRAPFMPAEKESGYVWHLNGKGKFLIHVFLDGKLMPEASWPNLDNNLLNWDIRGTEVSIFPDQSAVFNDRSFAADRWKDGIFHAIVERKWNAVQGIIGAHGADRLKCKVTTKGWSRGQQKVYNKNLFTTENNVVSGVGRGFVIHQKNAMDSNGEWFWDKARDVIYIKLSPRTDLTKIKVEARSRKYGLTIQNSEGVQIKGINFRAAGVEVVNSRHCSIDDAVIRYSTPFYMHNDEYNGKSMVRLIGGSENVIRNSYIGQCWGSGVDLLKGNGNRLENSVVEDVNWMGTYNACVRISGRNTQITGNTLRNSGRFLIYAIGVKQGQIRNNDMYNGMLIGQDGGGLYTHLMDGEGTEIAFNWIHAIKGIRWERSPHANHNISVGVYLDGGCKNFNVHHNVIWDVEYGVMYNASPNKKNGSSTGNRIDYNLIHSRGRASIVSKNLPALYSNNIVSHNLVNKKIGALAQKSGNEWDQSERIIECYFSRGRFNKDHSRVSISAGAYEINHPRWRAGVDPDKLSPRVRKYFSTDE